jgi:hypothetical protein
MACVPSCAGMGCEQCQPAVGVGGTKGRSKSPLVNSAERQTKALRVDSEVVLAHCPSFPTIISDGDKGKKGKKGKSGVKGKGGEKGGGAALGSDKGGGHGVEG